MPGKLTRTIPFPSSIPMGGTGILQATAIGRVLQRGKAVQFIHENAYLTVTSPGVSTRRHDPVPLFPVLVLPGDGSRGPPLVAASVDADTPIVVVEPYGSEEKGEESMSWVGCCIEDFGGDPDQVTITFAHVVRRADMKVNRVVLENGRESLIRLVTAESMVGILDEGVEGEARRRKLFDICYGRADSVPRL